MVDDLLFFFHKTSSRVRETQLHTSLSRLVTDLLPISGNRVCLLQTIKKYHAHVARSVISVN